MVGGLQLTSVCLAIYFTIYTFLWFYFYSAEVFSNTCINNQKRDFLGPYPWPLDLHKYHFPISSKISPIPDKNYDKDERTKINSEERDKSRVTYMEHQIQKFKSKAYYNASNHQHSVNTFQEKV